MNRHCPPLAWFRCAMLFAIIAMAPAFLRAQEMAEFNATAAVASDALEIGSRTQLVITLDQLPAVTEVSVTVPPEQKMLFMIGPDVRQEGTVWTTALVPLVSGESVLGPLQISARTEMGETLEFQAAPVSINVEAPAFDQGDPAEYAPILRAPANWTLITVVSVAGLFTLVLLLLMLSWIFRKLSARKLETIPAAPALSPIEEAFVTLEHLKPLTFFRAQGTKAHYSELSTLLRRYFERQEKVPALEMTEDEISHFVSRDFNGALADRLVDVFSNASAAKFARWEATEQIAREDLSLTERFLEAERLRLAQRQLAQQMQPPAKEAA